LQYGVEDPEPKAKMAVTVRVVSGDHIETAKKLAVDAGIIT